MAAGGDITCAHLQEYLAGIYNNNDGVGYTGSSCAQVSADGGSPPKICFEVSIFYDGDSTEFIPTPEDIDILIMVALLPPTVEGLIEDLRTLPDSNPLSGTTSVSQTGDPLLLRQSLSQTVLGEEHHYLMMTTVEAVPRKPYDLDIVTAPGRIQRPPEEETMTTVDKVKTKPYNLNIVTAPSIIRDAPPKKTEEELVDNSYNPTIVTAPARISGTAPHETATTKEESIEKIGQPEAQRTGPLLTLKGGKVVRSSMNETQRASPAMIQKGGKAVASSMNEAQRAGPLLTLKGGKVVRSSMNETQRASPAMIQKRGKAVPSSMNKAQMASPAMTLKGGKAVTSSGSNDPEGEAITEGVTRENKTSSNMVVASLCVMVAAVIGIAFGGRSAGAPEEDRNETRIRFEEGDAVPLLFEDSRSATSLRYHPQDPLAPHKKV